MVPIGPSNSLNMSVGRTSRGCGVLPPPSNGETAKADLFRLACPGEGFGQIPPERRHKHENKALFASVMARQRIF
jgi:hypothetical protein